MRGDLVQEILRLKKEKNAIILAHYYQPGLVQELADFVGDSYYLSEIARECKEEIIMFCGVRFMAESAKILSPHKTVLMPCPSAGCSMADMASGKAVLELKEKYPEAYVVCYINSTYSVKAHCDVAVTSSSALKILKNVPNKQIMFLPDRNLGGYISEFFPEKEFILWDGFCRCHNKISREDILKVKEKHKDAKVLVHPECTKEIRDISDYIGSTSGIIDYATEDSGNEFIIGTEEGILHELKKKNANKSFFIPGDRICCQDMKKTTLENLYDALLNLRNEIVLDEETRKKALRSLENMHKLANIRTTHKLANIRTTHKLANIRATYKLGSIIAENELGN
ncbi:quinolinate synthase A [Clostridium puniceum]|uniref:Quinolinate synthase n=1 Tax=Clostridium puniceum TaxID=29367 RepID=A0A1S8TAF6_9CLOT|nr:quinolinate synthase NadA [Clostridium puniceum]OOM74581.1 quinolinate synthase A [Clostridium puniceum]